jgi:PTH1 family peptidyl-tRNA hydrolase
MRIICGLGNPGSKYEGTRHNAGFIFLDAYAQEHGFPPFKEKWNALVSEKQVKGVKTLLIKPLSFMNLSGPVLHKFAQFYKVHNEDIWLVYDDVDLPIGQLRVRAKGSAGSHNGMKSVIQSLGGEKFPRIRLGIESRGEFAPEQMELSAFVLSPFQPDELALLEKCIVEAMQYIENSLA